MTIAETLKALKGIKINEDEAERSIKISKPSYEGKGKGKLIEEPKKKFKPRLPDDVEEELSKAEILRVQEEERGEEEERKRLQQEKEEMEAKDRELALKMAEEENAQVTHAKKVQTKKAASKARTYTTSERKGMINYLHNVLERPLNYFAKWNTSRVEQLYKEEKKKRQVSSLGRQKRKRRKRKRRKREKKSKKEKHPRCHYLLQKKVESVQKRKKTIAHKKGEGKKRSVSLFVELIIK